jgi:uncharacterized membrane protein YfcA
MCQRNLDLCVRHWWQGNVDLLLGFLLIVGGFFGAVSGIQLQQYLKALGQLDLFISLNYVFVLGIIGSLMLIESVRAIRQTAASGGQSSRQRAGQHTLLQRLPLKMRFRQSKLYASAIPPVLVGVLVGWLTAIMGVGGGFLLVPALIYVIRVPTRLAIGTSAFQIIFVTSNVTFLQAWQNQTVDMVLAVLLLVGGVVGAQIGARLGQKLRGEQLRGLMALMVLAVAIKLAIDLVITPSDLYSIGGGGRH